MEPDMSEKKPGNKAAGLFIPAGLFIGMGVGFLTNNTVSWMFIGMGVGFLLFALTLMFKK